MKRKTLTLVLCLLTVMSLVGVGFASWVIDADASAPVEGNIIVDTVADKRLELAVAFKNDQKDIKVFYFFKKILNSISIIASIWNFI